ncbi:hypothetical protein WN943_001401 [Citrus x changshan-huyou]
MAIGLKQFGRSGLRHVASSDWIEHIIRATIPSFNIIYAGGVSDSSGLASPIDPAVDHQLWDSQVHNPSIIVEDVEVNDNLSMASCADHQLQNIQANREACIINSDDNLIFSRATVKECSHLKPIFDMYTAASDQFFNMDKSSMFFSPNVFQHTIGDGKNIYVYKDHWIPKLVSFQPVSPKTLPMETKFAIKVRRLSRLANIVSNYPSINFSCFVQTLVDSLSKETFESFMALAWSIWRDKNLFLHNKRVNDMSSAVFWAESVIESYQLAQHSSIGRVSPTQNHKDE